MVVGEGELLADIALVAQAQDVAQAVGLDIQRPVQVVRSARGLGELRVVALHETREERVPGLHVRDPGKPQLLHQPVLQRPVRALDAALGLRTVGAEDLDVQLVQRPAELGHAVSRFRALLRDPEHRVLVRVEGNRAAMRLAR